MRKKRKKKKKGEAYLTKAKEKSKELLGFQMEKKDKPPKFLWIRREL